MKLTNEQNLVVGKILYSFKNERSFLLSWYTGSGKTNIFLQVIQELLEKNPKAKIGVSCYLQRNIKLQTAKRAEDYYNFDYFIVDSFKNIDSSANVFFFNPQVFYKKESNFKFDYLIVDEAHVGLAESKKMYDWIFDNFLKKKSSILFSSATPWEVLDHPLVEKSDIDIRPMNIGIEKDKFLTNFKIQIENVDIKINKNNWSRRGDLSGNFIKSNFDFLKKVSIEKALDLIKTHKINDKTLIIVPPGNVCAIASELKEKIGDSALCLIGNEGLGAINSLKKENETLLRFKTDPKIKFLVVVNKCQLGFDMPNLANTIDLTMTKNVNVMIQRWGRLARIDRTQDLNKKYFYVIDQQMTTDEAEWVLGTSIEYAMGDWIKDSKKSRRKIFTRKSKVFGWSNTSNSIDFNELMSLYKGQQSRTHKTFSFIQNFTKPGFWDLDKLLAQAKQYPSRTEFSRKAAYSYRKLRKYSPEDLEKIFPRKIKHIAFKEDLIEEAKKYPNRRSFRRNFKDNPHCKEVLDLVFGKAIIHEEYTIENILLKLKQNKGPRITSLRGVREYLSDRAEKCLRKNGFTTYKLMKTLYG